MLNKDKLCSVIAEHGENRGILAAALGISRATLSRKINEKQSGGFSLPELGVIVSRYRLTGEQIEEIFFADEVSLKDTSRHKYRKPLS